MDVANVLDTTRNGVQHIGIYNDQKIEILEGSEIDMGRSYHADKMERHRQVAIQNGNIASIGGNYKLKVSVSFTATSSDAMFILGGSTNGWDEWKNKDGKTPDELYRIKAVSTATS